MSQGQKEPSTYGPSWTDVEATLARLEGCTARPIELLLDVRKDVRGSNYLYVQVRYAGTKRVLGGSNYARGSANAAKTMAAACFAALLKAEAELDRELAEMQRNPVWQQMLAEA